MRCRGGTEGGRRDGDRCRDTEHTEEEADIIDFGENILVSVNHFSIFSITVTYIPCPLSSILMSYVPIPSLPISEDITEDVEAGERVRRQRYYK